MSVLTRHMCTAATKKISRLYELNKYNAYISLNFVRNIYFQIESIEY